MIQRKDFLEKMKEQLLNKKEEFSLQIEQLSQGKINDGQAKDSGDEASVLSMEKLQNSLQLSELDELNLIDGALARIGLGEYGSCYLVIIMEGNLTMNGAFNEYTMVVRRVESASLHSLELLRIFHLLM